MGFDLFILAILLVTTIRGAAKGVAWQLAGIAALVLCFMFATPLSLTIAPMIKLNPPLNRWVAMLGIYLVFSFGTFAVARGFREALEKAKFVEYDRHLGALFGLFKGAIIALVITFFAVAMSKQARDMILKTHTGFAAAHIMSALDPVMPKELHAILEPYIHQLDEVDPNLAREREKHHDLLDAEPVPTPARPGKGYRPTNRATDQFESEDERGATRDTFQADEFQSEPDTGAASTNQPRLTTPDTELEPADPTDSGINFNWLKDLPHLASKITPTIKKQLFEAFQNTSEQDREEFIKTLKSTPPDAAHQVARTWQNGRPRLRNEETFAPTTQDDAFDTPPVPKGIKRLQPAAESTVPIESEPSFETEPDPYVPAVAPTTRPPSPKRIRQPAEPQDEVQHVGARQLPPRPHLENNREINRQQLLLGIAKVFSSRQTEQAQKMTEIETLLLGLPDPVINGTLDDWLADLRGVDPDPDPHTDLTTNLNVRIARQVEANGIPHNQLEPEWQTKLQRFFRN